MLAPARRLAIRRLKINPGQTVVEVACGRGLNLEGLSQAAGKSGRVVAVEHRRELSQQAHRRIQAAELTNVELIESPVGQARLPEGIDRLLFCFAHDALSSPALVQHLTQRLAPAARVAATGPMRPPRWIPGFDLLVRRACRHSVRSFDGFERPWRTLAEAVPELQAERMYLGAVYVAWGQVE